MRNYQETRAKEIRAEAEKRAFALHTNQEHFVKKAFERLTKRLDVQDEIIRQSEECLEKLKVKLTLCTKGEEWKINREIKKHRKIIATAEARIEEEEDKEELIRKHTKSLLEVYRKNQLSFQAVQPNPYHSSGTNSKEKPTACEDRIDHISENQVETSQSKVNSGLDMNTNQEFREYEYSYYDDNSGHTVVKTIRFSENDDETDNHFPTTHADNNGRDVWASVQGTFNSETQDDPILNDSDWRLSKEIVYESQTNEIQSFPEDEWSMLFDKQQNDYENQHQFENKERTSMTWSQPRNNSSDGTEWSQVKEEIAER